MQYEVGVVEAHPLTMMWRAAQSVWRTWRFARAQGLPCNKWYGVYEKGSEVAIAHFGPLPGAEGNARRFSELA